MSTVLFSIIVAIALVTYTPILGFAEGGFRVGESQMHSILGFDAFSRIYGDLTS